MKHISINWVLKDSSCRDLYDNINDQVMLVALMIKYSAVKLLFVIVLRPSMQMFDFWMVSYSDLDPFIIQQFVYTARSAVCHSGQASKSTTIRFQIQKLP